MRAVSTIPLFVTLVLGGCAARPTPPPADPNTIGMEQLVFRTNRHHIPVGGRITFSNGSSRAVHVLVPGKDAQPSSQPGAPSFGGASGHRTEVGDRWTTPPWDTAGTYWVTCTLHPLMNLEVVVSQA